MTSDKRMGRSLVFDGTPLVMGILNVTPDSFSDGGRFLRPEQALRQADRLVAEGADIIDIGAESTRPGYDGVSADEEWARLEPVLRPLLSRCPVPISVDTQKACVAEKALAAGAYMINDVWGLQKDPAMAEVVACHQVPVVLTHNREEMGTFASVQALLDDLVAFLTKSIELALGHGISETLLIVDPGIGLGKTVEQNLVILGHLAALKGLRCPILLGVSRKSVIRETLGIPEASDEAALAPTIALNVLGLAGGASIFRVHDVAENKQALQMAYAVTAGFQQTKMD
ncbi:MAG: dihydropteroate synthase [Peptococcaceae bacterium]|nr:dihydropteroate synthase [Peptococcaceae bacterium]